MSRFLTRLFIGLTVLPFAINCVAKRSDKPSESSHQVSGAVYYPEAVPYPEQSSADVSSKGLPSMPPAVPTGPNRLPERSLTWQTLETQPYSTVSIDVDTASYARTRALIRAGGSFSSDLVRPEDFLNYFPYAYAAPEDERLVRIHQQLVASPWTAGSQVLSIGIKAKDLGLVDPPKNLVFLVDVSGSMADEDKLPLVKASLLKLTDSLKTEDRIALVTYAGSSEIILDSTSGSEKDKIKQAINRLGAGGSTNGGSGISLAYDIAQKQFVAQTVNRVILTTDGDFNVGVTNTNALVELVRSKAEAGIFLSILGFGAASNDALMENVARDANGNYFFIDTSLEIDKVFGVDLRANIISLAKDVKIQIEFNPRLVKSYRLIGYANRQLSDDEFNKDSKDAGDLGSGQTVTYLYELTPRPADETFVGSYQPGAGVDPLVYQTNGALNEAAAREEIGILKLRYKTPEASLSEKLDEPLVNTVVAAPSIDVRWQMAVAETAVRLGKIQGLTTDYNAARARAVDALGDDPQGWRQEFISLLDILLSRAQ